MGFFRRVRTTGSTIGELLRVLWRQKRWWLIPMVVVLLVFGVLLLLAQSTPLGPLIYTIF